MGIRGDVEAFSRPLLIKDILDKVERFCRSMERGGKNLHGNTRCILLRSFQGPFSYEHTALRYVSLYTNCGCKISCEKLTIIPDVLAVFFFSF